MPALFRQTVTRRTPRGRWLWRATAVTALTLSLMPVEMPPAMAQTPVSETSSSDASADLVEMVVSPEAVPLEDSASDYTFSVLLRNGSRDSLPAGAIRLELDPQRVATPDALTDAMSATTWSSLQSTDVAQIDAGGERVVTVSVPRSNLPLTATSAPGVYVVRASYLSDDTPTAPRPSATTPVVWKGSGGPTTKLTFVVPLVLPASIETMPTPGQLADLSPKFDELLTAATAARATLAIDPRILATIRAYGDNSPKSARDLLRRLETSSLPKFLLQFADADPAAQAAVGLKELLAPKTLDFVSRLGEFSDAPSTEGAATNHPNPGDNSGASDTHGVPADDAEAQHDGTTPTEDHAESDPLSVDTLPTLNQLLHLPGAETRAWPADGFVDSATLSLLKASGVSSVLLDSTNVTLRGGPRSTLGDGSALVTNAELGASVSTALTATTEVERAAGLAHAAAQLTFAAQTGEPGVVLALDRGALTESDAPAQVINELAALSWVVPTPEAEQAVGAAELRSAGTLEDRQELLRAALSREASVDEIAALLEHPEYLEGYQRARLLDLFATRYASSDSDFTRVARVFRDRDTTLLEGVRTINTHNTQLVGTSTRVPVQLRNSLPFDALVTVEVAPVSPALSLTQRTFTEVRVKAESTSRVLVPVRSRVSSGESGLDVGIWASDSDVKSYSSTLSISIRSSVEAIALSTLGVLAALLLVFGILRSIRRRRSHTANTAATGIAET